MTVHRSHMLRSAAFLVASVSPLSVAFAQSAPPTINAPPIRSPVDGNGVNLATGGFEMMTTDLSIGASGSSGLAHSRVWTGNGWRHGFFVTITTTATTATVSIGPSSSTFTLSGGIYTSDEGNGSTLTSTLSTFTYTGPDGTVITFDRSYAMNIYYGPVAGLGTEIALPSGEKIKLTYKVESYAAPPIGTIHVARLQSVNSTTGYQLKYSYGTDKYTIDEVMGINNGVDYCDPAADSCASLTQSWPTVTYSTATVGTNKQESVTNALGVTRFTTNASAQLIGLKSPGNTTDNVTLAYDGNGRVSSVSNLGATWSYGWSLASGVLTGTTTDPLTHQRVTTADASKLVILSDTDALSRTTTYQYDSKGRMTYVIPPGGTIVSGTPTAGYAKFDYDARGNIETKTSVSRTAGTPPNIVTSADYPNTCANPLICNKPTSTTNALGNVTNYEYDATTGFLTSVKLPAPNATPGTIRPETRYSYSDLYAYYKQASGGSPVVAPTPIRKLTTISACITTASCSGGSDEVKTTIGYGPQTSGTMNNLLPVTSSSGAGNGTLTATVTSVYDMIGNLYTIDGPLSGSADTTRYRFNAGRQLVGVVGPDPDGGGALKNRAARFTYDPDGRPTQTEQGTVDSQSDPDWSTFATLWEEERSYDTRGRLVTAKTPGATLSDKRLVQYGYDDANRLTCAVARLKYYAASDPVPSDPCALTSAGAYGPDRLTKFTYNNANQATSTITGFDTLQQRTEQTLAYNSFGELESVKDARNNLTTYSYDGFGRSLKTRYPSPTTPNTSSTTDYEEVAYNAASNVTQITNRGGSQIGLTYDNLNRLTAKNLPGSEPDVSYAYDNLGRLTSTSSSVATLSYTYDALNRVTRQASPQGNTDYQYDLASRRTRMTWPDSFYVTYDYLVTNDLTAIRENGATSGAGVLATFGYDNLGRRTTLTRGNGTSTSYSYDTGSRLTTLSQDLASTTSDQSQTFSFNPSSQITQQVRSNDAYAFTQMFNTDRDYTVNGLNQYTAAGTAVPGYDSKGNLTSFQGSTFSYSSENMLSATGSTAFSYDPSLRLYQIGSSVRFGYDGADMVGEYNTSNTLQRRYVFGPGVDEPIVWYEGAGTGDRRWLHADERGSITAISNGSGDATAINAYDTYGMPETGHVGRFGYTGQTWLPETGSPPNGLYNYKARVYSPRLGRFLQTDPVGYAEGMNLYNYVRSDPVNAIDPLGLNVIVVTGNPYDWWSTPWVFGTWGPWQDWGGGGSIGGGIGGFPGITQPIDPEITVTAKKPKQPSVDSQPLSIPILSLHPTGGFGITGSGVTTQKEGRSCNQAFLNFFNGLQDFGESTDRAGDATLVVAGGLAVTGALTTSTVVGAPVGLTAEGLAGGTAVLGLSAKTVGGSLKLIGDIGAAVETGTGGTTTGELIARAIIGAIPFNNDAVGAAAGAAGESQLPKTNIPRNCGN